MSINENYTPAAKRPAKTTIITKQILCQSGQAGMPNCDALFYSVQLGAIAMQSGQIIHPEIGEEHRNEADNRKYGDTSPLPTSHHSGVEE